MYDKASKPRFVAFVTNMPFKEQLYKDALTVDELAQQILEQRLIQYKISIMINQSIFILLYKHKNLTKKYDHIIY